jgi:hypothetical protein
VPSEGGIVKYVPETYEGIVMLTIATHRPDGLGRYQTGQVYSGAKGLFTASNAARRIAADPETLSCQITEKDSMRLFYSFGRDLFADRDLVPPCTGCGTDCHYFAYQMWQPFAELTVPAEWTRLITSSDGLADRRCPDVFTHYIHDPHPWAVVAETPAQSPMFACVGLPR